MGPKDKQIILWTQSIKCKLFWYYNNGLERRGYHSYQVDPSVFYREDSVISTYVDDFVIVSYKQEITT